MKRVLIYIYALALSLTAVAQESAKSVVERFLQKVEQKTLSTKFSMTISDQASQPLTTNGTIRMRGECFLLTMFSNEAAYDGKTFYLYQEDINELTLSTPTQEELLQANPVLFAKALMLQATLRFAPAQKEDVYVVEFIPNFQDAGVKKFVLRLRKSDLLPLEIQMKEAKQTTVLRFQEAKYESTYPSFILQKSGAYLNDMR